MNKNKFYITTPIYYVNAKPHLGTLYSTLLADAAARWHKLLGQKVFFLTGTDEHGQKIQEKALEAGKQPKAFVDAIVPEFKKVWQHYNIGYDKFIRTTDAEHVQAVTAFINKLIDQGDIYKSAYTGWYCVPCETFVTIDNESAKDAQGLYLCPSCARTMREVSEESYFFRLSAYEEQLLDFYENNPNFIMPKDRINEVISFVKSGLKDLSISRKTVSWGIPFPGDPTHTVYVWGDALVNYISALGYGNDFAQAREKFDFWWPAEVQLLAKDIVRFHAVYWPAFLMAAGLALPKRLLVHGYILIDSQKMSKSLGNAVDPLSLAQRYGVDQVRYYLIRQMAITQDGSFSLKDLEEHITADLANNLGNLLNRTLSLALKHGLERVTPPMTEDGTCHTSAWEKRSLILREHCAETYRFYWEEMNKGLYHVALAELWKFISLVNAFFHEQQPWALAQTNRELFDEVIAATCHCLRAIGLMLWPVMPAKMEALLASLGHTIELGKDYEQDLRENKWNKSFVLKMTAEPLFVRPEPSVEVPATIHTQEEKKQGQNVITIDDFAKVELCVGTIEQCEAIEGSEKLYKLQVNFGELGMRQVLSGIKKDFTPEELIGKQGVFVTNLAPRKMMGLESHGMMLFAKNADGILRMTTVGNVVPNGTRLQ